MALAFLLTIGSSSSVILSEGSFHGFEGVPIDKVPFLQKSAAPTINSAILEKLLFSSDQPSAAKEVAADDTKQGPESVQSKLEEIRRLLETGNNIRRNTITPDADDNTETAKASVTLDRRVRTRSGYVRGHQSLIQSYPEGPQIGGFEVSEFLGIPYAKPPVGSRRWKSPEANRWSGTLDADLYGPACPQLDDACPLFGMSEDCLTLNVWTPAYCIAGVFDCNLPVLVFIHGGSFQAGASCDLTYDGTRLAQERAVVVTINYRIGPLGFLVIPEEFEKNKNAINFGLQDQNLALRWVHENIAQFGGDKRRVTIFGESAGSESVSAHMLWSKSWGYFNRAIMQSGTMLQETYGYQPATWRFGGAGLWDFQPFDVHSWNGDEFLGYVKGNATGDRVKFARGADVSTILEVAVGMYLYEGVAFIPTLDGRILPLSPPDAMKSGKFKRPIEMVVGFNGNEGTMFADMGAPDTGVDDAYLTQYIKSITGDELGEEFLSGEYNSSLFQTPRAALAAFYGDLIFTCPSRQKLLSTYRGSRDSRNIYNYIFTHVPSFADPLNGASHGSELLFVFGSYPWLELGIPNLLTAAERELSTRMRAAWVNFGANGRIESTWPKWEPRNQRFRFWNTDGPRVGAKSNIPTGSCDNMMPHPFSK